MPSDVQWSVQKAVFTALTTATAVIDLLPNGAADIYDFVPSQATFPYCQISVVARSVNRTQTFDGSNVTLEIAIFDDSASSEVIKTLEDSIVQTLDRAELITEDYLIIDCRFVTSTFTRFEGGRRRGSTLTFTLITEPKPTL